MQGSNVLDQAPPSREAFMKLGSKTPQFLLLLLLAGAPLIACGGSLDGTDEDSGSDQGSSGGDPGDSGSTGGNGTGGESDDGVGGGTGGEGAQTGAGGAPVCCDGAAACAESETTLEVADDCPMGAECHSVTFCCSTVWCMKPQAPCDGIPSCSDGETLVDDCPSDATCVRRAMCGSVITCQLDGFVACDLGSQPNRNYIGSSAESCEGIDFACPEHTLGFSDYCGCGCEQPDTCPEFIDCAPGGDVDPLCESNECPYSQRGL
jgi:hypothetical protein